MASSKMAVMEHLEIQENQENPEEPADQDTRDHLESVTLQRAKELCLMGSLPTPRTINTRKNRFPFRNALGGETKLKKCQWTSKQRLQSWTNVESGMFKIPSVWLKNIHRLEVHMCRYNRRTNTSHRETSWCKKKKKFNPCNDSVRSVFVQHPLKV